MMSQKPRELSCEMVKDLLPLYCDEVVSEKTREAVKKHLETCELCQKRYERLQEEMPVERVRLWNSEEQFTQMMRKRRRRKLLIILSWIIWALILVKQVYYVLEHVPLVSMNETEIDVERVFRMETSQGVRFYVLYIQPVYIAGKDSEIEAEWNGESYILTTNRKVPVLGRIKDAAWITRVQILDFPHKNVSELRFGKRTIWTDAEESIVPEYLYVYEEVFSEDYTGTAVKLFLVYEGMVRIYYEDNRRIIWDLDGNVLSDEYPGADGYYSNVKGLLENVNGIY